MLHDILKEKIYVFKKVIYFPPEPVREFFFFNFRKGKLKKCWEHTNSSLNHFETQEYLRADEFINVEQRSCVGACLTVLRSIIHRYGVLSRPAKRERRKGTFKWCDSAMGQTLAPAPLAFVKYSVQKSWLQRCMMEFLERCGLQ